MSPGSLQLILFLFGIGFLAANVKVAADLVRYHRRRRSALLIWEGQKPRFYGFCIFLGVVLTGLFVFKLFVQHRPSQTLLGEAMMSVYYALSLPLSAQIRRGFYQDGVWSDTGFVRWSQISGVAWKEDGGVTLVLISHLRNIARRLQVPGQLYGEARRLLRERIKTHQIQMSGTGLDLGSRDGQDAI
jgi:hypothetical protein